LPTEAGPPSSRSEEHIDAINQVFALFKRNYHNQFFKAYSNEKDVNATKRLWLEALTRFPVEIILRAARKIIENNEFLPTLATIIKACETQSELGLPEAHAAFLEACQAPSPKAAHNWSHPAVYYAGKAADWFFLQNNNEHVAFPVFKQHYEQICQRVRLGEVLQEPERPALPESVKQPVDRETLRKEVSKMMKTLDL